MKKVLKIFFCGLLCLLILLYIGIVIINNCIADSIEKDLRAIPLPENTKLVDSISIAGKLSGNGNGMQYFGAILVSSDLSEEELSDYYGACFEKAEVKKQDSAIIFEYEDYKFDKFDNNNYCYIVYGWKYNEGTYSGDFFAGLLDCDIRGH